MRPTHDTERAAGGPNRFQILSLDGGGIRGVFTAAVLAAVEEDYAPLRVVDCFDLIAGTSTGGILALGLGLGYTPREMVQFYVDLGPKIFANAAGWRTPWRFFRSKFPGDRLADALKSKFGVRALGDSAKRLVVPSFNLGANEVYVFRTGHIDRLRRDYRVPAWEVAKATAAAPTYFPVHRLDGKERLVDGGVWANNPSMVALAEAAGSRHLGLPMDSIYMLSLGTVRPFHGPREALDGAGMWGWRKAAIDLSLDATSIGVSNQVGALLGERFLRVNTQAADDAVSLDNVATVDDLIGAARHESRKFAPAIAAAFLQHRAPEFTPWHGRSPVAGEGAA